MSLGGDRRQRGPAGADPVIQKVKAEELVPKTVRIPRSLNRRLTLYVAQQEGVMLQEVVARAIERYLDEAEDKS